MTARTKTDIKINLENYVSPFYGRGFAGANEVIEDLVDSVQTIPNAPTIISLGTSLIAQGLTNSATKFGYEARDPIYCACVTANNRNFNYINKGISAQTTTQILARVDADVIDLRPAAVFVDSGTNEIGDGYASITANKKMLFDKIIDAGIKLYALSILPRDTSLTSWDANDLETALAINAWTRRYCEAHPLATYVDWSHYWMDPADGEPIAAYTNDGTHISTKGGLALGMKCKEVLEADFPPNDLLLRSPKIVDGTDYVYGVVSVNPSLAGTSGTTQTGTSGDVADNWRTERVSGTTAGTIAATIAAKSTLDPTREQTLVFTPGGATGTEEFYFRTNTADTTAVSGAYYYAACGIDVSAWAGWDDIILEVDDQGSGGKDFFGMNNTLGTEMPEFAWNGVLFTPIFQAIGNLRLRIKIGIDSAASGTGTIKIWNPQLVRWNPETGFNLAKQTEV